MVFGSTFPVMTGGGFATGDFFEGGVCVDGHALYFGNGGIFTFGNNSPCGGVMMGPKIPCRGALGP